MLHWKLTFTPIIAPLIRFLLAVLIPMMPGVHYSVYFVTITQIISINILLIFYIGMVFHIHFYVLELYLEEDIHIGWINDLLN